MKKIILYIMIAIISVGGITYLLISNKGGNTDDPPSKPKETPLITPTLTPEVTPIVTPTSSPEETPAVTPKQTPTVTSVVTPKQTPVATPIVTPLVTPTAKPTAVPTSTPIPTGVETYVLKFNANGGKVSPTSKTLSKDSKYGELPIPTRDNYVFDGWYTKKDGGTKVTANTTLKSNKTIYAHWIKKDQVVEVTSVSLNKTSISLTVGKTKTLTATIKPDNATNKTIIWSSANEKIATVSSAGKIKAVKEGETTITATVGSKSAKCTVKVKAAATPTPQPVSTLDITENVPSDFTIYNKVSYSSSTLKYKIIQPKDGTGHKYYRYALIWVKDANKQLNNGNNNYKRTTRIQHFINEVKNEGYENKAMIGTNGGFAIGSRDNIPILASKGKIEKNPYYKTWINNGQSVKYSTLSISKDNLLIYKKVEKKYLVNRGIFSGSATEYLSDEGYNTFKKWMEDNGVRNAWAANYFTISDWEEGTGPDTRTTLCQIDENNFVLAVGNNAVKTGQKELHDIFGCKTTVNMDGGGSTGMYYKLNSNTVRSAYTYYRPSENPSLGKTERTVVDILYFVE